MIDQKRLVEKAAALGIDAASCAAALDGSYPHRSWSGVPLPNEYSDWKGW